MLKVNAQDKAKLIDPLYKASPRFWALVAVLLVGIGWGLVMYVRQLTLGLGETGMQRPVYWGVYMVNFVFFIGISHAGTLISAILRVTGADWRRSITRIAEAITAFALVVGTLQIIIDMGRPERLILTILFGRLQSPILWDILSVTAYFFGSITYLYLPIIPDAAILRDNFPKDGPAWRHRLYSLMALGWRGNRTQWLRLERAIAVMAVLIIPIAVSVHTIISWILATTVQPGWHSTIFGPYFVVGAIFSGIGALFVAMTLVRKVMQLETYITLRQYRNLGLLFITMNAIWMYFTYAEHLTLAAGQEVNEFPVLASKLWGTFAPGFWSMIGLMLAAFWIMLVPHLVPESARRVLIFQPRFALGAAIATAALVAIILTPSLAAYRTQAAGVLVVAVIGIGLGTAPWLKVRPVAALVIAAGAVLVGMWMERWNIIVPTVTHPYLVAWSEYHPTLTEIGLTVGSVSLFMFLFVVFFKLFPVVSVWEIGEGRVIEAARAAVTIPLPDTSGRVRRLPRRSFTRQG